MSGFDLKGNNGSYPQFIEVWIEMAKVSGTHAEKFLAKKGQALIWVSNLLHGESKMSNLNLTRWNQVTHYFFEDCAYTSPCANDVYQGQLFYRDIVDIRTGERRPNLVSGYKVDVSRVEFMRSPCLAEGRTFPSPIGVDFEFPADFNADVYLALNPDVRDLGISPFKHYRNFGFNEAHRYK